MFKPANKNKGNGEEAAFCDFVVNFEQVISFSGKLKKAIK